MKSACKIFAPYIVVVFFLATSSISTAQSTDADADVVAIKRLTEQADAAYVARDWDRFSSFFAADAVWMPAEIEPLTGIDEWWAFVEQFWNSTKVVDLETVFDEIIVSGDWAFSRYSETSTSATIADDSEPWTDHYKAIRIYLRQQDGSWKIARYIWHWYPPTE